MIYFVFFECSTFHTDKNMELNCEGLDLIFFRRKYRRGFWPLAPTSLHYIPVSQQCVHQSGSVTFFYTISYVTTLIITPYIRNYKIISDRFHIYTPFSILNIRIRAMSPDISVISITIWVIKMLEYKEK